MANTRLDGPRQQDRSDNASTRLYPAPSGWSVESLGEKMVFIVSRLRFFAVGAVVICSFLLVPCAGASPIIYTFTGVASGTVGTTPLVGTSFTITLTGDTSAITLDQHGLWRNPVVGAMTFNGIGTAGFTEPVVMRTGCATTHAVGVERGLGLTSNPHFIFLGVEIPFAACSLDVSVPVIGLTSFLGDFANIASTLGPITVTSLSQLNYRADFGVAAPVPVFTSFSFWLLLSLVTLAALPFVPKRSRSIVWRRRI
jgi:hypothetical protein